MPERLTRCNCSVCSRLGVLWGYFLSEEVEVVCSKEDTKTYIWGDHMIHFHHCPICGCTTHYTTTEKCDKQGVVVNFRMTSPEVFESLPIRDFDGASM